MGEFLFLLASFFFDGATFQEFAFVVFFPRAGEAELELDQVFFKVRIEWNKGKTFFVKSAD